MPLTSDNSNLVTIQRDKSSKSPDQPLGRAQNDAFKPGIMKSFFLTSIKNL
jgi:hypothetical protein